MSSKASIRKNALTRRIEDEGFQSVIPCERCVRLKRVCIRADCSDRCSDCVRAGGGVKCVMPTPTFTDAEWRRLVKSQNQIEEEEEAILAKLLRLRKQKRLLQKRAGDFIARDFKEVAELEDLERREVEERERLEKERVAKEREAESARAATGVPRSAVTTDGRFFAATSEDPTLTQLLNDPSFPWIDLDVALLGEAPGSPAGGTVEPAGGSPSGSR